MNGELRQDGSSGEMIVDISHLIEDLRKETELSPGDIILTGTTTGCGAFQSPPNFLGCWRSDPNGNSWHGVYGDSRGRRITNEVTSRECFEVVDGVAPHCGATPSMCSAGSVVGVSM
ncbi:fumarylacetoacetate hydrolase family protein [Nocardia sp. CY41]|uniref:fumarylacetoacetate hydrolase family protein n=1 Tax=Nocardia sp. CY41 TaxID=2608686 RepID=UPI001359FA18